MQKTLRFLLIFCFVVTAISAKQRNIDEAINIANSFMFNQLRSRAVTLRSTESSPYYYVFNIDEENGFVIVSGDDRTRDILGYSREGSFDNTALPENCRYWLSCYEEEIKMLSTGDSNNTVSTLFPILESTASVAPLLKTQWNQSAPYNNLCPVIPSGKPSAGTRTVTGCVATAMAQILKYHQYPAEYHFTKQYTTATLGIKINETLNGAYDWTNMLNVYTLSPTQAQRNAVAQLMYHCGIAVDMDYDTSSGAALSGIAKVLSQIFGYDTNLQNYQRDYYTISEWEELITNELNQNRPVFYAGVSSGGGHAFVCDGYDTNRLFHINWGWSGVSDGYFALSALNPPALGIGGGIGGGFNTQQNIIIGIQKPNAQSVEHPHQLHLAEAPKVQQESVSKGNSFTFSMAPLWNEGVNTFHGDIGASIFNANNQIITTSAYNVEVPDGMGYLEYDVSVNVPSNIANGNYRVYPVYRSNGSSEWQKMRVRTGLPEYVNMSVSSNRATFSEPSDITEIKRPNHPDLSIIASSEKIQISYHQDIKSVTIIDLSGNKLFRQTVDNQTITFPANRFTKGIYILQAETGHGQIFTKFIIR